MDGKAPLIEGRIVERIRSAYVEMPWTTAAGLGIRFGVGPDAGEDAVFGRRYGFENLAVVRARDAEAIQQRLGERGRVKVEPHLARASGGTPTHRNEAEAAQQRARRWKQRRERERARQMALKGESMVGASARAAALARWERRLAAKKEKQG